MSPETIKHLCRFLICQDVIETSKGKHVPICVEDGRVSALYALADAPESEISALAHQALQPLFSDDQDPRIAYDRLAEIEDAISKLRWEAIMIRDVRKQAETSQTLRFQSGNGAQFIQRI